MARLQELLTQSTVQNLGLGQILAVRAQEAQQLRDVMNEQAKAQVEAVKAQARSRRETGETLGALVGAGIGAFAGGEGNRLQGASLGAGIGQAVGGQASGAVRQPGVTTGADIGVKALQQGVTLNQQRRLLKAKEDAAKQEITQKNLESKIKLLEKGLIDEKSIQIGDEVIDIISPESRTEKGKKGTFQTVKGRKLLVDSITGDTIKDFGIDVKADSVIKSAQGLFSVGQIRDILGPQLGKLGKRGLTKDIISTKLGVGASQKARKIRGALRNSIDVILRERTGAAINPSEFTNAMESWGLQVGDSADVVNKKLNDLEVMLKLMGGQIDPGTEEGQKALSLAAELENSVKPYLVGSDSGDSQTKPSIERTKSNLEKAIEERKRRRSK